MIKYASIINEKTGLCSVGTGTNSDFYRSIGMQQLDVKQSDIDGAWYISDKCPMKTDEEKVKEERERLDNLSMTRGDVFEALILAKGLGKAQIRAMIEKAELDTVTKTLYLNRFDEALEFYRGYPIFDMLGQALGITGKMLDKFFETKDFHYLNTCKLTIKPIPKNATVTIEPNPTPYGETAHYKVECEGYKTVENDIEMLQDTELEIKLEAIKETSKTEEETEATDKDNLTVGEE